MTNKTAIVTGGGSGLGEAIAKALAGKGVKVVLADINLKGAQRVAREIEASGGTASTIQQDVARPEDSEKVVNHALDAYGGLHYAVNNAGIGGAQAPAGETDLADWARVINVNLNGVLYGMRYQIPAMLRTGARECAIVNMTSIHGTVAQRRVHDGQARRRRTHQERRGRVRAAGTSYQLCRPRVYRDPAAGCHSRRSEDGADREASTGQAGAARGSGAAGVLSAIRRGVVHDRRVLSR
jgi:NAD(P)-dependent dehydrogenase (short-subunit alcohol dehydrogenase family)